MEAEKARIFAVVSWGCAATNWLARALNAHPEIFCVHAGNFYWHHYGQAPYLDGSEYLATIREMGSSYAAAGDVHGVGLDTISAAREAFGDQFACAIVVREPIVRLCSQMALFKANLHTEAWNVDYVQGFIDQGVVLPVDNYENRLMLHAISMLNSIVSEQATAKIWRCEDLTTQPEALAEFVGEITGGSVSVDPAWAQATVALPAVFQHASRDQTLHDRRPQDWQIDAIRKIVSPEAWDHYAQLGYPAPDFIRRPARQTGKPKGKVVFDRFQAYSGPATEHVDWIGMRYRPEWWPTVPTPEFPALNEELFEWIDLLEAVDSARGRFTMLELGAGFGRWGIRGALAAKQRGIPQIRACFVDGEPQHVRWIRDALALNELNDIDATIVEAAASYAGKPIPFVVGMQDHDARSWYGQAVGPPAGLNPTERTYFGHRVHKLSWGDAIYVHTVTFEELAAGLDLIDLVDMDLQGAELELLENAADLFSRKVRRVHIGTHGSEIEDKLREIFQSAGWTSQWDFPLQTLVETEFGPVFFNDGVQSWINTRLS